MASYCTEVYIGIYFVCIIGKVLHIVEVYVFYSPAEQIMVSIYSLYKVLDALRYLNSHNQAT